jgi:DNA polymerase
MTDELNRLRRAARQLIETDRALAGEALAPGSVLPQPPAPAPAAPTPAGPTAGGFDRPAPARGAGPQRVPPLKLKLTTPEAKRKAAELEALEKGEVVGCTRCGLCKGRNNVVFGEGHPDADIVFIGEGPGQEEDRQGRPFVGRAGELLTKMVRAMGLTREDVYIANVVKCRPPGNRAPAADEAAACWDHLLGQLRIIQPSVIVALGNPATHALLNTTVGITRLRGQWQSLPMLDADLAGIKVMPTFHPAYLLRSYTPENRKKVWSDLQKVMEALHLPGK